MKPGFKPAGVPHFASYSPSNLDPHSIPSLAPALSIHPFQATTRNHDVPVSTRIAVLVLVKVEASKTGRLVTDRDAIKGPILSAVPPSDLAAIRSMDRAVLRVASEVVIVPEFPRNLPAVAGQSEGLTARAARVIIRV